MKEITGVIVLYNKRIRESTTWLCINNINPIGVEILIVDNSEIQDIVSENKKVAYKKNIPYISMEGNKGLSKAYNMAINKSFGDVIILFDDDTEVTANYFDILIEALEKYPDIDVFAPIVYGQDGVIYSPNNFNFLRSHFLKNPNDEIVQDKFNAISSCLAIRRRVFEDYRFNEELFVDQVDQLFFCEQRECGRKFKKLNTVIHQNFHQREKELSPKLGWGRLKLRIVDIMRHAKLMKQKRYIFLGVIKCCGLGLQISLKSKSIFVFLKAIGLTFKCLLY